MNPGSCDADLLHAALAEPLLWLALVLGEARVPGVLAAAGRGQRVLGALRRKILVNLGGLSIGWFVICWEVFSGKSKGKL